MKICNTDFQESNLSVHSLVPRCTCHQWHSQDEQVMWAHHGHTQCVRNTHLLEDMGHVPAMKKSLNYTL